MMVGMGGDGAAKKSRKTPLKFHHFRWCFFTGVLRCVVLRTRQKKSARGGWCCREREGEVKNALLSIRSSSPSFVIIMNHNEIQIAFDLITKTTSSWRQKPSAPPRLPTPRLTRQKIRSICHISRGWADEELRRQGWKVITSFFPFSSHLRNFQSVFCHLKASVWLRVLDKMHPINFKAMSELPTDFNCKHFELMMRNKLHSNKLLLKATSKLERFQGCRDSRRWSSLTSSSHIATTPGAYDSLECIRA